MTPLLWCIAETYKILQETTQRTNFLRTHQHLLQSLRYYHNFFAGKSRIQATVHHSLRSRTARRCSPFVFYNSFNFSIGGGALQLSSWRSSAKQVYSIFHNYKTAMNVPPGLFRGCTDRFNGITVESSNEYEPNMNFEDKLQKSIDYWIANKRRTIWFKVQTQHAEWIPYLTKSGFNFHHAKNGFLLLYRWLPTDESANIPSYAHSMVGVGGLVVNDKDEVLVVSDRFALIPDSWKLPGGYVEPAENLIDAAIREVREETGIDTTFNTVVCIRHSHAGSFGCSDMYIVIALTPKNLNFQRCEREIARVQWLPLTDYLQHPNVHQTNRHFMRIFLEYKKLGIRFTCQKAKHQVLKIEYNMYFMKPIEKSESKPNEQIKEPK